MRACQPKDVKRREWKSLPACVRERVRESEREKEHTHMGVGGGEREGGRAHTRGGERERESVHARRGEGARALWLLFLYVFSATWAYHAQIGLSQECCST